LSSAGRARLGADVIVDSTSEDFATVILNHDGASDLLEVA
jgi:hypothetical protein